MLSFHRLAESQWAKFRNCDLAGAECRGREHAGKIGDVEDRSGVEVGPAFGANRCFLAALSIVGI
jgi:hypothetical protein